MKEGTKNEVDLEVYTAKEAARILKVSGSTLKRLLRGGALRAGKVGGQYRILRAELVRLLRPE